MNEPEPFFLRLPALPGNLRIVRRLVGEHLRMLECSEDCATGATIAANEAVSNVARHAYPDGEGDFELELKLVELELGVDEVELTVRDEGRGIVPNPDSEGAGWGWPLIVSLSQRLEITSDWRGTQLLVTFAYSALEAA